jgi:hypothetical protein
VQRADHVGRHLGKRAENGLTLSRADVAVGNALPRHELALERRIARDAFESLA